LDYKPTNYLYHGHGEVSIQIGENSEFFAILEDNCQDFGYPNPGLLFFSTNAGGARPGKSGLEALSPVW
jgi:hypothetical protein